MNIYIFGSCGGSAPYPNRHHASFAVDYQGGLYWFDAGESCSYTAHLMGIDLMKTRKICISHTHMDHIGGLGNLFWTIRKLDAMNHNLQNRELELFIPELEAWKAIETMLKYTEGNFKCDFTINASEYKDGLVFEDRGLKVSALHNNHFPHTKGSRWKSFGFSIEGEGKKIVYTGDTGGVDDVYPLLASCDFLLFETGHHHPADIAQELIQRQAFPGLLAFIHHGRDILNHYTEQTELLDKLIPGGYRILNDTDVLIL
jgi:ribonuclease BN (tRNA processing enzyme)